MESYIYAILLLAAAFTLFSIRVIFIKGAEFRGTCSSNNPMLRKEIGECTVCGRKQGEPCGNPNQA